MNVYISGEKFQTSKFHEKTCRVDFAIPLKGDKISIASEISYTSLCDPWQEASPHWCQAALIGFDELWWTLLGFGGLWWALMSLVDFDGL